MKNGGVGCGVFIHLGVHSMIAKFRRPLTWRYVEPTETAATCRFWWLLKDHTPINDFTAFISLIN